MSIAKQHYGSTGEQPVEIYTLRNAKGLTARLTFIGAKLVGLDEPDRNNAIVDVALGFDDL